MPVTINTIDTSAIKNSKANDATPVEVALTTVYTNTANLKQKVDNLMLGNIEDSASLVLNSGLTTGPTNDGRFIVNRGSSPDVEIIYRESSSQFEITNNGLNYSPIISGAIAYRSPGGRVPKWASSSSVTFPAGIRAMNSTLDVFMALGTTVTLNMATTGAGGLDSGTVANNTWYYAFLISGSSGTSVIASTNPVLPTLPTGYTYLRRLLPMRTNSTGLLFPFFVTDWGNDVIEWTYSVPDFQITDTTPSGANVCLNNGVATTATDVSLTLVPPDATHANIAFSARSATSTIRSKNLATFGDRSLTATSGTNIEGTGWVTLDSATYRYLVSANNTHHACLGFKWPV